MGDTRVFPGSSQNLVMPEGVQLVFRVLRVSDYESERNVLARPGFSLSKSCPHGLCPEWYPQSFQASSESALYRKDHWVIVLCEVRHQCRLCKWVHQGPQKVLWRNKCILFWPKTLKMRLTVWLAGDQVLFRGCKCEIGGVLPLGFPGPQYCLILRATSFCY